MKTAQRMVNEADELMSMSKGLAEAVINNDVDTYQNYRKLAGEVEARNVSARLGMSEQERRESLLSETEDVAREDQIVLMDGLGVSDTANGNGGVRLTSSNASISRFDKVNGTNVRGFIDFLKNNKEFVNGKPTAFHIANAGGLLSQFGIKGKFMVGQFTFSRTHTDNADHELGIKEWIDVINNLNNPIAITSYKGHPGQFRLYTYATINGRNICVGVNVSTKDGNIELSNIISAYGRDIQNLLGTESVFLLYPATIEELKQRISQVSTAHNSLLNATSSALSEDKDTNNSENDNTLFRIRITPEQDAAYMKAVESGDMETGRVMHSIPVIEEMKESVMEGQVMFRTTRDDEIAKRSAVNNIIDGATAFVNGTSITKASEQRRERERKRKEEAAEIYSRVLNNQFDDVTLQLIDKYIQDATPKNPYGRRISQRLPQEMERGLHEGKRETAVNALFSRISESAVSETDRASQQGKKEIETKKKELLKNWAIASGMWYDNLSDVAEIADTNPIDEGTESKVYASTSDNTLVKVKRGKPFGKRFRPDIDDLVIFNHVFPNTAYTIIGYGDFGDGISTIVTQPVVNFAEDANVSVEERVEHMKSLGFKPMNKDNTAFTNGKIVASDIQGKNIVKTAEGNIRVIDADMKLHTKDMGGEHVIPPVEEDTLFRIDNTGEFSADNNDIRFKTEPFSEYKSVRGDSEFGPIYEQFRGKPKEAVEFLMEKKTGEAVGALNHKDIGDISIVYGNDKAGLKKIAAKHPEVLDVLQDILDDATIVQQSENRVKLESDRYFAVISKDYLGKPRSPWLLTSFEKKNSVPDNTMDTGETSKGSKQNDTATLQNTVSDSKDQQ